MKIKMGKGGHKNNEEENKIKIKIQKKIWGKTENKISLKSTKKN